MGHGIDTAQCVVRSGYTPTDSLPALAPRSALRTHLHNSTAYDEPGRYHGDDFEEASRTPN